MPIGLDDIIECVQQGRGRDTRAGVDTKCSGDIGTVEEVHGWRPLVGRFDVRRVEERLELFSLRDKVYVAGGFYAGVFLGSLESMLGLIICVFIVVVVIAVVVRLAANVLRLGSGLSKDWRSATLVLFVIGGRSGHSVCSDCLSGLRVVEGVKDCKGEHKRYVTVAQMVDGVIDGLVGGIWGCQASSGYSSLTAYEVCLVKL